MGKGDKIIEMPKNSNTNEGRSLSVWSTYNKIKNFKTREDFVNLTLEDRFNINCFYRAALIFSGIEMRSGIQQLIAREEIEALIGNFSFSIDMYRFFVKAYGELLKNNVEKFYDANSEVKLSFKLA